MGYTYRCHGAQRTQRSITPVFCAEVVLQSSQGERQEGEGQGLITPMGQSCCTPDVQVLFLSEA